MEPSPISPLVINAGQASQLRPMSSISTSSQFLNGIPVKEIVFLSRGGGLYHKGIPQSSQPVLGMGIREDGSGAHCYLYQNGSELMKEEIRLDVPRDCLVRRTVTPESPARFTLPVSASTFSALAVGAPGVNVTVDREQRSVTLRVDRAADVYFVAFGGTYLNWWPMPVIGYPPTSRSASSGPSTE